MKTLKAIVFSLSFISASNLYAGPDCKNIHGDYQETLLAGNPCASPVGLCLTGQYFGQLKGTFSTKVTSILQSIDSAMTGVVFATGDINLQAKIGGKNGTLILKDSGTLQAPAPGNSVDLLVVIGGTGDFAGASGTIRANGTFSFATGTGESEYEGTVCVP
jgi:Protein of unknown function (DUF3224)